MPAEPSPPQPVVSASRRSPGPRLRIVQVVTGLSPAGAERVVTDLSLELKRRGHDVTVVSLMAPPRDSGLVDELRTGAVPVRWLGVRRGRPWSVFGLGPMLRDTAPDVIHAHLFHAGLAVRLARPRGARLVQTVHVSDRRPGQRWRFLVERATGPGGWTWTSVSRATATFHAARLGIPADAIRVIPNGVRPPAPPGPDAVTRLREAWGVASCRHVLGSVGRLAGQKGFDRLVPVLRELARGGDTWGLVLLGEGPERRRLESVFAGLPPEVTVVLPGYRADAASCAGAFDVFVMPSRFEGFGLVAVEAMCHGLPVVASPVDSLPEVLSGYPGARLVDFSAEHAGEAAAAIREACAEGRVSPPPSPRQSVEAMVTAYEALYGEPR